MKRRRGKIITGTHYNDRLWRIAEARGLPILASILVGNLGFMHVKKARKDREWHSHRLVSEVERNLKKLHPLGARQWLISS